MPTGSLSVEGSGHPAGRDPKTLGDLDNVVRYILDTVPTLAAEKAFARIVVTIQNGQIEFVHCDRSWKPSSLPVRPRQPAQRDLSRRA